VTKEDDFGQTLGLCGAHNRSANAFRLGLRDRYSNWFDAAGVKHTAKRSAKFGIGVMQDEADRKERAVDYMHGVTSHLDRPFLVGMPGDPRDGNLNVVGHEAMSGQHFHCKAINACQNRRMRRDEVRPADFLPYGDSGQSSARKWSDS
jgi:hypothetical protein